MLKLAKIQRKPKLIEKASSFRVSVRLTAAQKASLDEIYNAIITGEELPVWAYRSKLKIRDDQLLNEMGVMHLHIGAENSRELLYVVQYNTSVLLLEISNHASLQDEPRGTILYQLHQVTLRKFEEEEEEAATALKVAQIQSKTPSGSSAAVRAGIKPRSRKD